MAKGQVITVTEEWWKNVCDGIFGMVVDVNKRKSINTNPASIPKEFDYWTNSWLPDPKRQISELLVYYLDMLVLVGNVVDCYKATPAQVHSAYLKTPQEIGLPVNENNSLQDFNTLLRTPFKGVPDQIGNIIFTVKYVDPQPIVGYKKLGSQVSVNQIPDSYKEIPSPKSERITYIP